jgi:hypothetical protein
VTLKGYWPLNEESGNKAYDHSGNENHGDVVGGPERASQGIIGDNSTRFPNKEDSFSISDDPVLNPERITLCAWANYSDLYEDQGSIFRKYKAYVLYADNSSRGMQFYNWGDGTRLSSEVKPAIGEWEFWTATNDGSKMKIYRNAELIATISSTTHPSTSNELGIGAAGGNQDYGMTGKIQEARLYNRALTKNEIQYLYQVGKRGRQITSRKTS